MDISPIPGMSYAVHANEWPMASKALQCPLVLTSFLASFFMEKGVEEMAGTNTKICGYIIGIHLCDLDIKHNKSQYTTHFYTTHGYLAIEGSATLSEHTFSGGKLTRGIQSRCFDCDSVPVSQPFLVRFVSSETILNRPATLNAAFCFIFLGC